MFIRTQRPAVEGSAYTRMPSWSIFSYDWIGWIRKWIFLIYTIVKLVVETILTIFRIILSLAQLIYPWLIWITIFTFLWYLCVIYWPYVIALVLTVVIPILNVLIVIANFVFELLIIFWDIFVTIWNMVVPFIGMILYIVINVVLTVLEDIFNIIGSIDWEPVISAFMDILNVIIEIATQVLLVLIKVGGEVLKFVAKIITPLLEIFMEFVKVWAEIVSWIFKLLFKILEPILSILGAFFGSSGSASGQSINNGPDYTSKGSSTTARRLLGLDRFKMTLEQEEQIIADYHKHVYGIPDGLSEEERDTLQRLISDQIEDEHKGSENSDEGYSTDYLFDNLRRAMEDDVSPIGKRKRVEDMGFETGRKLQGVSKKPWKQSKTDGLKFIMTNNEPDDDEEEQQSTYRPDGKHLDDLAHTMAHQMYVGAKQIPVDDYHAAKMSLHAVLREHKSKPHFSLNAIIGTIGRKYEYLRPAENERLSSVRYASSGPEHPKNLLPTFHEESTKRYRKQLEENVAGRKLMENYKDVKGERLNDIRLEHAKQILTRYEEYRGHHETRIKVAMVVYGSVTRSLKHSMMHVATPQNILKNYGAVLNHFGYKSIQDVRIEYAQKYGDPWYFLTNVSLVTEHPILKVFKRLDPSRHESPFYHDWAIENQKLKEERELRVGRKLLSSASDVSTNNGDSSVALSGFSQIASLNCYESPKNPLCLPFIPMSTKIKIPLIKLTDHQRQIIESPTTGCTPWRFTNCLICGDRVWNAFVDFFFIFSAIPYINYPLAVVLDVFPWARPAVSWIFIVPARGYPTTYQWVCFAFHLYDLWVTIIATWLIFKVVTPLYYLWLEFYDNVQELIYGGRGPSWFARCTARAIRNKMENDAYARLVAARHPLNYRPPGKRKNRKRMQQNISSRISISQQDRRSINVHYHGTWLPPGCLSPTLPPYVVYGHDDDEEDVEPESQAQMLLAYRHENHVDLGGVPHDYTDQDFEDELRREADNL